VVLFIFAGREANMRLQMPFLRRIVEQNPNVQVDIWNLARLPEDAEYLQTLGGERISVRNEFYRDADGWNAVWRYYAHPRFEQHLFVKIDDDVVFIETDRFAELVEAAKAHPGAVTSAQVVNNGACTRTHRGLWSTFARLDLPLLDVHLSNAYAQRIHEYFFSSWDAMVHQPVELVPSGDWLSINLIAMDHSSVAFIAKTVGTPSPAHIAGRDWQPGTICGDEGAANMLPRYILTGMVAGHLTFGPQYVTTEQGEAWRAVYESIGTRYLTR
jgi:hypothetical protein